MERDTLVLLLEQGLSVERIAKRFGKDPSTVSYWMEKYGLRSPYAEKHAARGGIPRERLEALVEEGTTIAEIAAAVNRSKGTVRHWMRKYGLKSQNGRGSRRHPMVKAALEAGGRHVTLTCARHGMAHFIIEGRGYYRCKRCRAEQVTRRRRRVKALLVAEAGGKCRLCGYSRYVGALQFHHVDPAEKRLELSRGGALAIATLRAEAKKCVVLCSNCHAEVEAGIVRLPLESWKRISD